MVFIIRVNTPLRRLSLPLDSDVIEAVELCLKSLTHVFSWVPLTTAITSRLLSAVFQLAALGLHSRVRLA
jgi:hypothetical protein